MYKKYKYKHGQGMYIEYQDDLVNGPMIFKKSKFEGGPIDKYWIPTNWKSWQQITDWTKDNGWKEIKELHTEVDYLNAFQDNFKDGG